MRFLIGLLLIVSCALLSSPALAASDLLFGAQEHRYSVVMRGNGEAIVYGKLTVPNTGHEQLKELRLTLGVSDAQDFVAYQEVAEVCDPTDDPQCLYADPDHPGYSRRKSYHFEKMTVEQVSYGTTTIIFAYRSMSYTHDRPGYFSFDFMTPTVDNRISSMTVSVSTDSDLYLKGGDTEIDYDASLADTAALGMTEESLTVVAKSIGRGSFTEHASNMQAGESLTVSGMYSEHKWITNLSTILLTILAVALVTALAVLAYKKLPRM